MFEGHGSELRRAARRRQSARRVDGSTCDTTHRLCVTQRHDSKGCAALRTPIADDGDAAFGLMPDSTAQRGNAEAKAAKSSRD